MKNGISHFEQIDSGQSMFNDNHHQIVSILINIVKYYSPLRSRALEQYLYEQKDIECDIYMEYSKEINILQGTKEEEEDGYMIIKSSRQPCTEVEIQGKGNDDNKDVNDIRHSKYIEILSNEENDDSKILTEHSNSKGVDGGDF